MALARKLAAPTGRPVVAIMPTGGSTVDARPRSPESLPYDPPVAKFRKSTVGGKKHVPSGLALRGDGPTLAALFERERRRAGLPASQPAAATRQGIANSSVGTAEDGRPNRSGRAPGTGRDGRSPDEPTAVPTDVLYHASGHAVGSPPARRRTAGTGGGTRG